MYQDDVMDISAFRFFEKPIDEQRLYNGLEKAMEYIDENCKSIWFVAENVQSTVLSSDIVYVERKNRQVILVTKNREYITRESFEYWSTSLQSSFFL